jgi:hypothetical protein
MNVGFEAPFVSGTTLLVDIARHAEEANYREATAMAYIIPE